MIVFAFEVFLEKGEHAVDHGGARVPHGIGGFLQPGSHVAEVPVIGHDMERDGPGSP